MLRANYWRAVGLASWTLSGFVFGAAIGLGIFTEPTVSWWEIVPWLAAAWLVGWIGSLMPTIRGPARAPLGSVVLAVGLALTAVLAAILIADWWIADTRVNPRPDRGPILVLWSVCGGLGGVLAGFGAGWVRSHHEGRARRLSVACRQGLLWLVFLGVLAPTFLPISYALMSAPFRVPIPAIHHLAIGWMLSGAFFGLLVGSVGDRLARVGLQPGAGLAA